MKLNSRMPVFTDGVCGLLCVSTETAAVSQFFPSIRLAGAQTDVLIPVAGLRNQTAYSFLWFFPEDG